MIMNRLMTTVAGDGLFYQEPGDLAMRRSQAIVRSAGIITALMALATNAGNLAVEFLARFSGRRTRLLIATSTALATAAAVAGLADSFWTVLLMMLLLNAAQGVGGPVQRAYLHTIAPSAERATVVSAVSLVGGAGGIVGQLGLGWIARTHSLASGYLTAGLTLLVAVPRCYCCVGAMSPETPSLGGGRPATKEPAPVRISIRNF
jgi:MFS family permease